MNKQEKALKRLLGTMVIWKKSWWKKVGDMVRKENLARIPVTEVAAALRLG